MIKKTLITFIFVLSLCGNVYSNENCSKFKKFSVDLKVYSPAIHLGPYTKILFFEFSERLER